MTELALFDPRAAVPAHIAAHFAEAGSNIENKQSVPSLSPMGKQWTVSLDGTKTTLTKRNADGDAEPVNTMKVVIVDFAKRRGRTFYEGAYDPANESPPVCWSADGIAPDASVPDEVKQTKTSFKCDTCPMSAKGSKVDDRGKATTACSQHRMLVVVPANKLDFEPLRLKIAMTSDWDKQSPDAEATGWYAFQNYLDFLKSRGAERTDAIVTRMKFDPNVAYPKIFFKAERFLEANELAQVAPLAAQESVQGLLGASWTPAGPDGVKTIAAPAAQPVAGNVAAAAAATTATAVAASPPADDDDGDDVIMGLDAPAAAAGNAGVNAQQAPVEQVKTTAAPVAALAPAVEEAVAATTNVDPGLGALLANWGDD